MLSSLDSRYAWLTIAPVKCSTQFFTPLDTAVELAQERLVTVVLWVFRDVIPNLHQRGDDARVQSFPQIYVLPEKL